MTRIGKQVPKDPVVRWFRQQGTVFEGATFGADAIAELSGEARLVTLGEASHGASELFLAKRRAFEALVKKGFTTLMVECSATDARAVDAYVRSGEGDPRAALGGLGTWVYKTKELLGLVEWMRAFNEEHGPALRFVGLDMEQTQTAEANAVAFLAAYPELLAELTGSPASQPLEEALRGFDRVVTKLEAQAGHVAGFPQVRQDLQVLRDSLEMQGFLRQLMERGAPLGMEDEQALAAMRDGFMARNANDAIADGSKGVLWVHNGHASEVPTPQNSHPLGQRLREEWGSKLVTVATVMGRGDVRARPTTDLEATPVPLPLGEPPRGSVDEAMARATPRSADGLVIDLRTPAPPEVTDWLNQPHPLRNVGAVLDATQDPRLYELPVAPRDAFDLLWFVEDVTASRPL